jgi:hypothetical protein
MTVFLRNTTGGFSFITSANLIFLLAQLYFLPFGEAGDNHRENLTLAVLTFCTAILTQAPRPLPNEYAVCPCCLLRLIAFDCLLLVFQIPLSILVLLCIAISVLYIVVKRLRGKSAASSSSSSVAASATSPTEMELELTSLNSIKDASPHTQPPLPSSPDTNQVYRVNTNEVSSSSSSVPLTNNNNNNNNNNLSSHAPPNNLALSITTVVATPIPTDPIASPPRWASSPSAPS